MDYLLTIMVTICQEKAYDVKSGLRTMNACQEYLLNCAVGPQGQIDDKVTDKCVERLKDEKLK